MNQCRPDEVHTCSECPLLDGCIIDQGSGAPFAECEPRRRWREAVEAWSLARDKEERYRVALEHIAYNISLSIPMHYDGPHDEFYKSQLCTAISTAARTLQARKALEK